MKYEINTKPSFTASPYPLRTRLAQEELADGKKITIPVGTSIPDYIRLVYKTPVYPLAANFSFLDRDNEDRVYQPEKADPYVFKSRASITQFHKQALMMMAEVCKLAQELGLPLVRDEDRGVMVPDSKPFIEQLAKKGHDMKTIPHFNDVSAIFSTADILKKVAIQRTIIPGWFAVSYDGKTAPKPAPLKAAGDILVKVFNKLRQHPKFQSTLHETFESQGDPLDTAIGFPSFSSEMGENGMPIAKLRMLNQYKGVAEGNISWLELRQRLVSKATNQFERDYLFAVGAIRRIQPNYKWIKTWKRTSQGLHLTGESRGYATNRVAWAAPYLLNLLISPVQTEWKTLRKLIPGMYHDGTQKTRVLKSLATTKRIVMESDFSNYDRSIPVDVISHLFKGYAATTDRPAYWFDALNQTQYNLPVIWGDQTGSGRGRGWIFVPKSLALLSGLKITSEVGSYMNLMINIAGWREAGVMSDSQIIDYLTTPEADPFLLIASDDTLLIADSVSQLLKMSDAFKAGAAMAGVSAKLELGDKFLMRHTYLGRDTPVAARVWQNTLSNENPPSDMLTFFVGLLMRTDGMLGHKTFDPFGTGTVLSVSRVQLAIDVMVIKSLLTFISTAALHSVNAEQFLNLMLEAGTRMVKITSSEFKIPSDYAQRLDRMRKDGLAALAKAQMAKYVNTPLDTWLYALYKDAASPAAANLLAEMAKGSDAVKNILASFQGKEHTFYAAAMKILKSPTAVR